jgi:hypothetical protein
MPKATSAITCKALKSGSMIFLNFTPSFQLRPRCLPNL